MSQLQPREGSPSHTRRLASPHHGPPSPNWPPARVLVVEDHEDTRDILETLLKTEGYEVLVAGDGEQGLALYRRGHPDVVVLDIFLPHKDGIETIRDLRRECPDVAIVAISADASSERRNALTRAREAGAQLTIRKPVEPWVLLRGVAELIAVRRLPGMKRLAG